MEAKIVGFKGSRRDMDNKYGIIEGVANPASLIGQTVNWQTQGGNFISGKVVRTHGSRGAMARFSRGLPGTALGSVVIIGRPPAVVKKAPKKPAPKAKPVKKPAKVEKPKAEKKAKKVEKPPTKPVVKPAKIEKKAPAKAEKKAVKKAEKKPKAAEKKAKAPAKKGKSAPKSKGSKKK